MKSAGTKTPRSRRAGGRDGATEATTRGDGGAKAARGDGAAAAADPFETLRRAIDDIDLRVVKLLNERAGCAIALGRVKKERGLPVYQPAREEEVLRNVERASAGPLEAAAVRRLFERIIDESRRIERVSTESDTNRPAVGRPAAGGGDGAEES